MTNPPDDDLRKLEEKIAYLERHIVEQDKAMLEMNELLARVTKNLHRLKESLDDEADPGAGDPSEERPPHY